MEGLYYLYSKNNGADQLHVYRATDLHLVFAYTKSRFSHDVFYDNLGETSYFIRKSML